MNRMYETHPEILEIDRKRKQRTRRIILLVISGVIIFGVALFFLLTGLIKSSDAYMMAIEHVRNDKTVQLATGGVKDFSFTSGQISTDNGHGEANFEITVEGEKNDIDVFIELEKEPEGEWKVLNMDTGR